MTTDKASPHKPSPHSAQLWITGQAPSSIIAPITPGLGTLEQLDRVLPDTAK
jgi:hypothetical protein